MIIGSSTEILVFPSLDEGARYAAVWVKEASERAIHASERRRFVLALSGGSTPRPFHAELVRLGDGLDWKRIHIVFSDERAVGPSHPDSNFRMAKETLLDHVAIPAANIHRVEIDASLATAGEASQEAAEAAATAYSRLLEQEFLGQVDCALLGMGQDGHTASLFPGGTTSDAQPVVATVASDDAPIRNRVSFSFALLRRIEHVLVLVSGAQKAAPLAKAVQETHPAPSVQSMDSVDSRASPMGRVLLERSLHGKSTMIIADRAAARLLQREEG